MSARIAIPDREFIKAVARKAKLYMSSPDRIEAAEKFFAAAYRAGAMNEAKRQEEVIKQLQRQITLLRATTTPFVQNGERRPDNVRTQEQPR